MSAAPPNLMHQVAVVRRAADEGRGDVVGAAGDDRHAFRQPEVPRRLRQETADDLLAPADRRQQRRVDLRQREQARVVGAGREIDETRLERPVVLDLQACR